jgi:class 3 adenylate cyclase
MSEDYEKMSFTIPVNVASRFRAICRAGNKVMSREIADLMRDYNDDAITSGDYEENTDENV